MQRSAGENERDSGHQQGLLSPKPGEELEKYVQNTLYVYRTRAKRMTDIFCKSLRSKILRKKWSLDVYDADIETLRQSAVHPQSIRHAA